MNRARLNTTAGCMGGSALRVWTRFVNLRASGRYRIATACLEEAPLGVQAARKRPVENPSSSA
jgi:hypothetical protein